MGGSWKWIDRSALVRLHDESLAEHGGAAGVRSEHLLDSALARPINLANYGDPDIADLAASYALGPAKGHAFVDGNKRAAFLAIGLFLYVNSYRLIASQAEATVTMLALAAGQIDEAALADWIRRNLQYRY